MRRVWWLSHGHLGKADRGEHSRIHSITHMDTNRRREGHQTAHAVVGGGRRRRWRTQTHTHTHTHIHTHKRRGRQGQGSAGQRTDEGRDKRLLETIVLAWPPPGGGMRCDARRGEAPFPRSRGALRPSRDPKEARRHRSGTHHTGAHWPTEARLWATFW